MASSTWTRVARAGVAGLRPRTAILVPTLRHSFARSGIPRQAFVLNVRGYAVEATARAEASDVAGYAKTEDDMSDDAPLFSSLEGKIDDSTLKALTQSPFNYKHMSAVQGEVLPLLPGLAEPREENPQSKDLLVKARTGTGKTIAFLVPAIEARIKQLEAVAAGDPKVNHRYATDNVGALIISPTRELASQIVQEAQKLTSHHKGWQVPMFVGGLDKSRQLFGFQRNRKDILVATPGRLRDMLEDRRADVAATLKNTKMLILDEADTLLDMGFRDDIEAIMKYLPNKSIRQTLLFSATVSEGIKQIASRHLEQGHRFINCVSSDTSPVHAHIPQYHTVIPNPKDQIPHILRLIFQDQLEHGDQSKIILFLSTTKMTQLVSTLLYSLSNTAFPMPRTFTYEIHSKKTMGSRTSASNGFRKAQRASILVTSDVSARGIDYPGVTRVIQVGIPKSGEQYVHRIGRTGRGGSLVGRGDLVVAAWEHEFVKRNLSHIPLKPLTVKDFKEECVGSVGPQAEGGKPHSAFLKWQDLDRSTTEVLSQIDEAAVSETMSSMLGFYVSMLSDLRINSNQLLDELQKWTTDGLGLARAPYVSPSFLARIGAGGKRDRGSSFNRGGGFGGSRAGFGGRGGGGYGAEAKTFGQKREWRDNDSASSSRESGKPWMKSAEMGERKPWEARRPSFNREGGDRPPRRSFGDSDSRPPRNFGDFGSRPSYSSGRERGADHQSRRSKSWENRESKPRDDF